MGASIDPWQQLAFPTRVELLERRIVVNKLNEKMGIHSERRLKDEMSKYFVSKFTSSKQEAK